ncbi:MAG: fatty acyl-AMP ligase [Planctomycetota bacterium]
MKREPATKAWGSRTAAPASGTLLDVLRRRARDQPRREAITCLADGEATEAAFDYRTLDERARSIAAGLQRGGLEGKPVLLLLPPGASYVLAFLGCIYAGAVPVPAYPPHRRRVRPAAERLARILDDAGARAVIGSPELLPHVRELLDDARDVRWIVMDDHDGGRPEAWRAPRIDGDSPAFLQYTSGSTGHPRGVIVTHRNLLGNLAMIRDCYGLGPDDRGVIWLPPYHDMGLIGGVLEPLFTGFPVVLFPPLYFIQRPARWLRAVSRYRATISGGPDFAYALCTRRIAPEERARLDLRSWRVAFNGSEPIRADTLEDFRRTFAPQGFSDRAFYPCYGLAEATLFVVGPSRPGELRRGRFDATELRGGRAVARDVSDPRGRTLVGCGSTFGDLELRVVDPGRCVPCAESEVGELWVRGSTVAAGYWGRPEESAPVFGARLADGSEERYLRTGDLGFVHGGETFVTGRRKELIVVRGSNHYPQDIERTVERCHPALEPASGAAFLPDEDADAVVVVQAVRREAVRGLETSELARDISEAVAERHGLRVERVVLTRATAIPRTSSGKVMRGACRDLVASGSLEELR